MNVQYAVQYTDEDPEGKLFVIEVNPRASRTVPFVSKATGHPLARLASLVMVGKSLEELGFTEEPTIDYYCVKEAVLPFIKFTDVDPLLGPEMRSTGEVMGIAEDFGVAFAKSQAAAGSEPPPTSKRGRTAGRFPIGQQPSQATPDLSWEKPFGSRFPTHLHGGGRGRRWPKRGSKSSLFIKCTRVARMWWTGSRTAKSIW